MDSIYHARWITTDVEIDDYSTRMFQRKIEFDKKVLKAVFHVTALGIYEAYVNEKQVGKDYRFLPGWTHYSRRVQYQSYDVTKYIKDNQAIISVHVARGWFGGRISGTPSKMPFAMACALDIIFEDGTKDFYISMANDRWKAAKTKVIFSDIYDGETYDERLQLHDFQAVKTAHGFNPNDLVKQQGEYVKEQEILPALKLIITPRNERVIDFGQNMTGYVRFTVKGRIGQRYVISHAEVLDNEGCFYTDNLRGAKQRIEYISNGRSSAYSPHFSFQGFRYIRLDEWSDNVNLEDIKAVVVHSDIMRTGFFNSSSELLNKLYTNAIWGAER